MTEKENPTKTPEQVLAEAPEKEAPEVEKPVVQEGEPKEKGKGEEAPPLETITKEEHERIVSTIKGGHKGTTEKLTGDVKDMKKRLGELQTQYDEKEIGSWLAKVEQDGGDVGVAKTIVEREQVSKKLERDLTDRLADIESREALLNEAGKGKTASDLIKTHELGEDVLEELLKAESLTEMENKALKLRVEKQSVEARQPEKLDKGQKASTKGQDLTKVAVDRRLGLGMEGEL